MEVMQPEKRKRLIRSTIYEVDSDNFYLGAGVDMVASRKEFLDKQYAIKEVKHLVSYREINHWDSEGLLHQVRQSGDKGWRKFSISDLLWLKVLKTLRSYGLPISTLKRAAECAFFIDGDEKFPRDLFGHAAYLCSKHCPIYAIVYPDGWLETTSWADMNHNIAEGILDESSYLTINLNKCMSEIFPKKDFGYDLKFGLHEYEAQILKTVKESAENSEIIVCKRKGEVDRVLDKSVTRIQEQDLPNFLKGLESELSKTAYGDYTIKLEQNKPVSITRTNKKKV